MRAGVGAALRLTRPGAGDLTGDLFLQESSGAQGGTVSFTIEGDVKANVTIPHGAGLTIGGTFGEYIPVEYYTLGVDDIVGGDLACLHSSPVLRRSL